MSRKGRIELSRSPDRDMERRPRRRVPTSEWSTEEPTIADQVVPADDHPPKSPRGGRG
jgi:hypothetical protein